MRRRKFSAGSPTSRLQVPMFRPILDTRTFMVNLNSGLANLRKKTGFTEFSTPDEYLRGLLETAWPLREPPCRRPASGSKKMGCLLVRGTPQELDAVEQTVRELNGFPSRKPREDANSGTIMDKASSTPAEIDHSTNLETRTFKVDPRTFYSGLESAGALSFGSTNISLAAKPILHENWFEFGPAEERLL